MKVEATVSILSFLVYTDGRSSGTGVIPVGTNPKPMLWLFTLSRPDRFCELTLRNIVGILWKPITMASSMRYPLLRERPRDLTCLLISIRGY